MVSYPGYMYFQGSKLQSGNETRLAMNVHVGAHDLHTQRCLISRSSIVSFLFTYNMQNTEEKKSG